MENLSRELIRASSVIVVVAALVAAPALASTKADFDSDADFSSYKTFAWIADEMAPDRTLENRNPLAHKRIVKAVEAQLGGKGLTRLEGGEPDIWLTYHATVRERVELDSYGYGGYRGWGPAHVQTRRYTEGTFILDMVDALEKELVWRGSITKIVNPDPEKMEKRINKAVAKLMKKYPPKKK